MSQSEFHFYQVDFKRTIVIFVAVKTQVEGTESVCIRGTSLYNGVKEREGERER